PRFTYIGGPTALLEWHGLRFLTDPTFDPAGTDYKKRASHAQEAGWSAISADSLGAIDIVLLSHDHHPDNLDHVGRALLTRADKVITTVAGAERLGGNALGLANWQSIEIPVEDGAVTI